MKINSILLKVGDISGMYYYGQKKSRKILIYGLGAPTVPDNGTLPEARVVVESGYDMFVPDYIGFGRSKGVFTPRNCIKTFLNLYDCFGVGVVCKNHYLHKYIALKYKKIVFAGRSLGGTYVALLPRFNKKIAKICVVFGALDQSEQGKVPNEETNEDFIGSFLFDGYKNLYRGFSRNVWWRHVNDIDGLSPIENAKYLENAEVFIAHGRKDSCVNFSKSVTFYQKLVGLFPEKRRNFHLKIYEIGGHDSNVAKKALKDYLKWIEDRKRYRI